MNIFLSDWNNVLASVSDERTSLSDVTDLAPVPQLKLLSCHTNPFFYEEELSWDKNKDWQDIISDGLGQIKWAKGSPYLVSWRSICKYKESGAFSTLDSTMSKKIQSKFKWVEWNDHWINNAQVNESPFYSDNSWSFSFTLLSNSSINTNPLKNISKLFSTSL